MDETKFLSLLGLCRKAGKVTLGSDGVCDAVRSGGARLVILTSDASDNTKKKIKNCASYYGKRLFVCETDKETLGRRLGRAGEASCAAVCDESFAAMLERQIDESADKTDKQ